MAVYKNKGIVLRSIRYGEADRILDLYTRDSGLVSTIAKGIRRTKSRFGARLEPLSCVEFLAYEGKTLDTITQVEVLRSFRGVREDLARFETASSVVKAVRALSGGDEADRRVFNLLYHTLDALESRKDKLKSLKAAFSLKLSILAGYTPRLDNCVVCDESFDGASISDVCYFTPLLGGALCAACRKAGYSRDSFAVPPGTLAALQSLGGRPVKEAAVEHKLEESVYRVISAHVLAHAPGSTVLAAPDSIGVPPRPV